MATAHSEVNMSGNNVFVLQHVHYLPGGDEDVKLIGVYSSRLAAEKAIERLASKPGFSEPSGEFFIDCYPLDVDFWEDGFEE